MTTRQPQPVRSSLLFSPVVSTQSPTSLTDEQLASDLDTLNSNPNNTNNNTNNSNNNNNNSTPQQHQHHRRRSDFRSKSTDQIISNSSLTSTNSFISSTTLFSSPPLGKFNSTNVSQQASRPAPVAPVPIPATRFDTITSYVDVIYQHQQHQQQQQQQQGDSRSQPEVSNNQNNEYNDQDLESQNYLNQSSNGIVYLDPSEGIDGDQSFMVTCPQCTMVVMTDLDPFPGNKSRRMACWLTPLLLCWLPFSTSLKVGKRWMDVKHSCPKCQSTVAIYRK